MSRCSHGVKHPYFCPLCQRESRQAAARQRPRGPRAVNRMQGFIVYAEEILERGPLVQERAIVREPEEAINIACKRAEERHGGLYAAYLVRPLLNLIKAERP